MNHVRGATGKAHVHSEAVPAGRAERFLERAVDWGLAGVLFLVPLALGGRCAVGQFVLVATTLWTAGAWAARCCLARAPRWSWSGAELVVLAAVGLVALQITPLPPAWIQRLSPHLYPTLPLWSPQGGAPTLGVWNTLSLDKGATRGGLVVLLCHAILLLVALQRIRRIEDVERVLRWIAWGGTAMAAFALVQHFLGNGKYFWFYQHPFADCAHTLTGSLTNRNHLAHFVALGIGPVIWSIQRRRPAAGPGWGRTTALGRIGEVRWEAAGWIGGLGVSVFAVLLSLSRGGAISMFVALGLSLLVLYRGSVVNGRTVGLLLASGAIALALLAIYGYEKVSFRLYDLQSIERLDELRVRRGIWRANLAGIADFPAVGCGLGSHSRVYPLYLPEDDLTQRLVFTHAESGYLQTALETGLVGAGLLLSMIALCGVWCLAPLRSRLPPRTLICLAAILASLSASALQSLWDFVWFVPACLNVALVLAACAYRIWRMGAGQHHRRPPAAGTGDGRLLWGGVLAALAVVGYPMVRESLAEMRAEPSWNRFVVEARAVDALPETAQAGALVSMLRALDEVVCARPDHAAAHARLAEIHVQLFDHPEQGGCPIPTRQVRQSALASAGKFRAGDDLEGWLRRAFGGRWRHLKSALDHARRAVALCPLEAEAYLCLAEVGFLDAAGVPAAENCVDQALRVRPYDGRVLFEAGQEALLAGRAQEALRLWRKSFGSGSTHQVRLVGLLAGVEPAEFFLQAFDMDWPAVKLLDGRYRELKRTDQARALLRPRIEAAARYAARVEREQAVNAWLDAAEAHRELGETAPALDCLRRAVQCDRSNYDARRALGIHLFAAQELAEAKEQLDWCFQRHRDEQVRVLLDQIVDRQVRTAGRSDAVPR
jgi:O-antigen ligase/tetratricopeptide (TPR) repeat protein